MFREEELPKNNDLGFYLKKLEKKQQIKPQENRRIYKVKTIIKEIENEQ